MIDQRDRELNEALEAMHFGFRALIARPDERLRALGLSRVHHRLLYFIGRHPDCSVGELLGVMQVSKQYAHKPLKRLIEGGWVEARADARDRRIRRLRLSGQGARLEAELSGMQRRMFAQVFEAAGPEAEAGWREVMRLLRGAAEAR